jgi:salicylate hydroxylase
MYRLALDIGVEVKINSKIERYESDAARVVLENGQIHSADLVVACDGVKSEARKLVLEGVDKPPRMTGFAAYRATIDVEDMKRDPDTAALLRNPSLNLWSAMLYSFTDPR